MLACSACPVVPQVIGCNYLCRSSAGIIGPLSRDYCAAVRDREVVLRHVPIAEYERTNETDSPRRRARISTKYLPLSAYPGPGQRLSARNEATVDIAPPEYAHTL